jgi:branched-chain amino acid transport system permease protein
MAIRDDELAAEGLGVPTLRLKLIATTISGAMMGLAGTTFPYLITYMEPTSVFNLSFAVNSIAMPIVGGLGTWLGPVIGALLLGTIQQVGTVTLSSTWNLLIVGGMLVFFVTVAPNGIMGIFKKK